MKWSYSILAALLVLPLGMQMAHAAEFKSVGAHPAVLYNAPSERGRKIFIAPRGMPVEIILSQNNWSKVRDATGDLSWIEASALSAKRTVVVTAAHARLYARADTTAELVATIDKGVLLEWLAPPSAGWVKVKHSDGLSGFVKVGEVWGE